MPSMEAYGIPPGDWPALAQHLLDRLADLMLACAADTALVRCDRGGGGGQPLTRPGVIAARAASAP